MENQISSDEQKSLFQKVFQEDPKRSQATGGTLPYYEMEIDSHAIKGSRNWENRWEVIKDIVDYRHKDILDLGCNCGILPIYLKKFQFPGRVVGIDHCPYMIEDAQLLSKYFGVDCEFKQVTIGEEKWEDSIGSGFDIVFCLSLYMWIKDKEEFLHYLARFPCVIFENHDSVHPLSTIESIFKNIGFHNQTRVHRLTDSTNTEYHRTLLLFQK